MQKVDNEDTRGKNEGKVYEVRKKGKKMDPWNVKTEEGWNERNVWDKSIMQHERNKEDRDRE